MYKIIILFIVSLELLHGASFERPTIIYFHGRYTLFPLRSERDIKSCIELLKTTPITHLTLQFSNQDPTVLASILPYCSEAISLRLIFKHSETAFCHILANASTLINLKELDLGGTQLAYEALETLSNSPHLTNLEKLDLSGVSLNQNDQFLLTPFISKPNQIKKLMLSETGLDDNNLIEIARSPHLSQLQKLEISRNKITSRGVEGIAISSYMRNITYLNLSQNTIEAQDGFWTLLNTVYMANLTYLNLSQNYICNSTGLCVISSIHLSNLIQLFLDSPNATLTTETAIRIVQRYTQESQTLKELTLTLEDNTATNVFITALLSYPTAGGLQRLYISEKKRDHLARLSVKKTPWEKIIQ